MTEKASKPAGELVSNKTKPPRGTHCKLARKFANRFAVFANEHQVSAASEPDRWPLVLAVELGADDNDKHLPLLPGQRRVRLGVTQTSCCKENGRRASKSVCACVFVGKVGRRASERAREALGGHSEALERRLI